MPHVRCRFFDEAGSPIGSGCPKGPGECAFIHPSSPQWRSAPKPRTYYPSRGRGRGGGGGGGFPRGGRSWDGDSGRGGDEPADAGWGGRTGGGSSRGSNWGGSSRSGGAAGVWGDAGASSAWGNSFGGSSWDTGNAASSSNQAGSSASAAASGWDTRPTAPTAAPAVDNTPALDWGAPSSGWGEPSGGWGAPAPPTSADAPLSEPAADWGAPPPLPQGGGGWGDPAPTTVQRSPDREKQAAEEAIWGDSAMGKSANTPSMSTPQWATPRTPRSPDRSPQRERVQPADPRRRSSTAINAPSSSKVPTVAAAMSPSDEAAQSIMAKEGPAEETRLLSWGVPAPVSAAGPRGESPATNPFVFTDYTPMRRMDIVPPEQVEEGEQPENVVREVDMEDAGGESRTGSKAPSRASSPISPATEGRPKNTNLDRWKEYTRLITKAVALNLDLTALNETQGKLRALQRSSRYRSASMTRAHDHLSRLRTEHDAKLRRVQRKFDDCLDRLAKLPVDGPPAEADLPPEVEKLRKWVLDTMGWVDSVRPLVETHVVAERVAAEARVAEEAQRLEEEEARQEEAALVAKAREAAAARAELVVAQVDSIEEKVTDLELQVEELRTAPMNTADVVLKVLRSRKDIVFSFDNSDGTSQKSVEEGDVPPPPPKTQKQLEEECTRLEAEQKEVQARYTELLAQIKDERTKILEKKVAYHQLAADMAEMQIQLSKLNEEFKAKSAAIEESRAQSAAVAASIDAIRHREPAPPPPPPTLDELATQLIPLVRHDLRGALHEGLSAMRCGVDEALTQQEEDISVQVWQAFQPVMRLIQQVRNLSDHHPGVMMPPPPPPVQSVQHS